MKKRKWLLLVTVITGVWVWYHFFYKSYSRKNIPASADMVLSVDIKKNTNTIIGYYITTPGEWDLGSIFRSGKSKDSATIRDAITIPDYVFIFHSKGQPSDAWYCLLTIKSEEDFDTLVTKYGLTAERKENGQVAYYAPQNSGIDLVKKGNQVLAGNAAVKNKQYLQSVAKELFEEKKYIAPATLEKIIAPSNHFSFYMKKNDFLAEDAVLNGNFKNGELLIDATVQPGSQYLFREDSFAINDQSLLSLGLTQPAATVYASIPPATRNAVSVALNFNIDSLFIPQNKKYQLDIAGISQRTDSAVSYSFDDDFNKVEKVVVNEVQEPAFAFTISGGDPTGIFQYWKSNKNIIVNDTGNLFVAVPFVKTYVYNNTKDSLSLTSFNYHKDSSTKKITCIGCCYINPGILPPNLLHYFPNPVAKFIASLEAADCIMNKNGPKLLLKLSVNSKSKHKPFLLSLADAGIF